MSLYLQLGFLCIRGSSLFQLNILKDGRITVAELEDFIAKYSETDLDTEADFENIEEDNDDYVYDEIDDGSDE